MDPFRQNIRHPQNRPNVRISPQDAIRDDGVPEPVVADYTRAVGWHFLIEDRANLVSQGDECPAFFREDQSLERANVIRMDGEQSYVLVHLLIHFAIELRERRQV